MISFLITIAVFLLMECVTWLTHKYVMHGFMWYFHADHHQPKYANVFERNDIFFIIFAIPSIVLFYFGANAGFNYLFFIGLGITLYGFCYFMIHDILIHQRFKLFKNTQNPYLVGLRKGHKVHHKHLGKEEGECFGMLFVPFKYYKSRNTKSTVA
ncbi:sterol desaturase family protein [Flavobacterium algicola]|uniref:sterol desaturase family protein n=1 Tax=Flavobacterium algicola TaxID=556529 RepID=UPI001EFCF0B8|nr:sterol desaturase family protein [Flavobacterium algicola]MCG9790936.1 sterol desaturase family protein [Flavobacterium algicola]